MPNKPMVPTATTPLTEYSSPQWWRHIGRPFEKSNHGATTMEYFRLDDPLFDRQLSLRDAYKILEAFVVQYNARGESSTVNLMTNVGLSDGGTSGDPAQIHDFVRVSADILRDDALLAATSERGTG